MKCCFRVISLTIPFSRGLANGSSGPDRRDPCVEIAGYHGRLGYIFLKMDDVKFKSMAIPGDTLIMKMELIEPIRRGIVHMKGTIFVGDRIVSEGDLTAQIVKRNNGK